jgi:hypothetical protein
MLNDAIRKGMVKILWGKTSGPKYRENFGHTTRVSKKKTKQTHCLKSR